MPAKTKTAKVKHIPQEKGRSGKTLSKWWKETLIENRHAKHSDEELLRMAKHEFGERGTKMSPARWRHIYNSDRKKGIRGLTSDMPEFKEYKKPE